MGVAADSNAEMEVYDRLGPKAREAIGNSPRIVDIRKALSDFTQQANREFSMACGYERMPPTLNLADPVTDAKFAAYIDDKIRAYTGKPIADYVVRRRRGKP